MKYAAEYIKSIDLKEFDEIIIPYNALEEQIAQLPQFLSEYKDQRIILQITDVEYFFAREGWKEINEVAISSDIDNLAVCIYSQGKFKPITSREEAMIVHELDVPYFFGKYATNLDELKELCTWGVSDVYIAEGLGFDLKRAKALCDHYNIRIRAFANVSQTNTPGESSLFGFFITPQDAEWYSKYIDVIEFFGPPNRQGILLDIYKSGQWYGDLKPLIIGLDATLDTKYLMPIFSFARSNCRKECYTSSDCKICNDLMRIHALLKDNNLIIKS